MPDGVRESVREILIEEEMKDSYLTFAMSVIVSRALPDARDGLKPSQRRILVAMNDLSLGPRSKTRKSAKIAGDTTGNYHPHGQEYVYLTMVRMAQEFNFRYPLVDGQGNFGSMDGDPPAAMRYTEARLAAPAMEMLEDLERDTVDFIPNYDDTRLEPTVLPSKFPNLLVNGGSGIAVGMATSIPPHNLREICDGLIMVLDNPDATLEQLMTVIKGPDFPGGGILCGQKGILDAYRTGRGSVIVRARAHTETTKSGKVSIVFTEVPYLVNRDATLERIGELVKEEVLDGISDLRNESDKDGTRLVVELRKDADEQVVLNQLYKHTALQDSFSIITIALVNNRPQTLTLKQMLQCHIDHRKNVIRRRTQYLLDAAEKHLHILEGLLIALKNIDAIIEMIKVARTVEDARASLMASYGLSEAQANAILEMRLQRLTGLEQEKIEAEHRETRDKVTDYKAILADERRVIEIIRADVQEMKDKYGDDRRTEIAGEIVGFEMEDLIAEEEMVVTITHEGYIKRLPVETYRAQRRGGKGVTGADMKEGDFVEHLFLASTHDYILFFTDRGKVYWQKVYDIPQLGRAAKGRALVNMLQLDLGEKVTSTIPVRTFDERFLVMVTEQGMIKKTPLTEYSRPLRGGIIAIKLTEGDKLIDVRLTRGDQQVLVATADGRAVRFEETDVRPMGRNTQGVIGARLRKGDKAVGLVVVDAQATLLSVCEHGYGKRTSFEEYRLTSRGAQGVINIKTTERNGKVVGVLDVTDEDQIVVMSQQGMVVRMQCKDISTIGRATQGVRIINLNEGDRVTAIARVVSEEEEEKGVDRTSEAESKLPKPPKPAEGVSEKLPRLIGPDNGNKENEEE